MNPQDQLYRMLAQTDPAPRGGQPPRHRFPALEALGFHFGDSIGSMLFPMLGSFMQGPLGIFEFNFWGNQNILQSWEARHYYQKILQGRESAARADMDILRRMAGGMTRAMMPGEVTGYDPSGNPIFTERGRRFQEEIAKFSSQALPFLAAIAPDTMDDLFGQMGLRTIAVDLWVDAGRFATDRSGRAGGVDTTRLMNEVHSRLFPDRNTSRTSGLGSRRIGEIFNDLSRRGVIGGAGEDFTKTVEDATRTIEQYAEAVSAVRDLFVAEGRSDAPMAEILASLKAITQRGPGSGDPQELARIARQFHGAVRFSGLGLEEMVEIGTMARAVAPQLGIRSASLGTLPLQVAASVQAYKALGYAEDSRASAQTLDIQEFKAADAARRVRAAASPMANLVGAVLQTAEMAAPGTELAQIAAELKQGRMPAGLTGPYAMQYLAGAVQRSGLNAADFAALVHTGQAGNQGALAVNPRAIEAIAVGGQRAQLREMMTRFAAESGLRVSGDQLLTAVEMAAGQEGVRTEADLARRVAGMFGGGANEAMRLLRIFSQAQTMMANIAGAQGDAAKQYSILNLARLAGGQTAEIAENAQNQHRAYGDLMHLLRSLGRGSILGRLMQGIADLADPNARGGWEGVMDLIAKALGGVKTDEVAKIGEQIGGASGGILGMIGRIIGGAADGAADKSAPGKKGGQGEVGQIISAVQKAIGGGGGGAGASGGADDGKAGPGADKGDGSRSVTVENVVKVEIVRMPGQSSPPPNTRPGRSTPSPRQFVPPVGGGDVRILPDEGFPPSSSGSVGHMWGDPDDQVRTMPKHFRDGKISAWMRRAIDENFGRNSDSGGFPPSDSGSAGRMWDDSDDRVQELPKRVPAEKVPAWIREAIDKKLGRNSDSGEA